MILVIFKAVPPYESLCLSPQNTSDSESNVAKSLLNANNPSACSWSQLASFYGNGKHLVIVCLKYLVLETLLLDHSLFLALFCDYFHYIKKTLFLVTSDYKETSLLSSFFKNFVQFLSFFFLKQLGAGKSPDHQLFLPSYFRERR